MRAKMIDQQYREGICDANKYEIRKDLDLDVWTTTYVTDLDIVETTATVKKIVEEFIDLYIGDYHLWRRGVLSFTLNRNGMTNLWQFSVATRFEVNVFEVIEPDEWIDVTEQYRDIVQQWYDNFGIKEIKDMENLPANISEVIEIGDILQIGILAIPNEQYTLPKKYIGLNKYELPF